MSGNLNEREWLARQGPDEDGVPAEFTEETFEAREPAPPRPRIISETNRRQLRDGKEFILAAPNHVPAIWGRDNEVLWPEGESLKVTGPPAVGKGTLLQQMTLRRAGVLTGDLLGFPVKADPDRLTLYLALDRPKQIARSLKRMIHDQLDLGPFVTWEGPLPFDLVKRPEALAEFALEVSEIIGKPVGTVCIDSIKDVASKLSSDEVGGAINRAIGGLIAQEIEVAGSHHGRKATAENKKPTKLADVYGSQWITAGAGSVILLWGEPGDQIVELSHLKPPAEEVGPFNVLHDHDLGVSTRIADRADTWEVLQGASDGITAADTARIVLGGDPDKNQIQKIRRRLDRLVTKGHAAKINTGEKFAEVLYKPTVTNARVTERDEGRDDATHRLHSSRNPGNSRHAPVTHPEHAPLPLKGEGKRDDETTPPHDPQDDPLSAAVAVEKSADADDELQRILAKFPEAI